MLHRAANIPLSPGWRSFFGGRYSGVGGSQITSEHIYILAKIFPNEAYICLLRWQFDQVDQGNFS